MKKRFFKCIMILGAVIFAQFTLVPATVYPLVCTDSMTADPTTIDFSDTAVGANSASTIVTLTNTGCSISDLSLSITGADSSEFDIESTKCTESLGSSSQCQTKVYFTPSTAGAHTASFRATFDTSNTVDVALTGTGIVAPASDNTALLVAAAKQSQDDSDGCSATAATGTAGKKAYGPAALGLVAMLGLVMATAAVRRRSRKRD